jgi:hypothetical protein
MKLAVFRHAFNGYDIRSVHLDRKHGAGLNGQAVGQDRARAADARFAANVRTGQAGDIAYEVCKQKSWFDILFEQLPVDGDFHVHT